jgi:hypothetical protein
LERSNPVVSLFLFEATSEEVSVGVSEAVEDVVVVVEVEEMFPVVETTTALPVDIPADGEIT